ncbi:MAG: glycosyl transferase [Clostridiales bacterium]|nr:glycosyl transferase [Clostridiales bacterium]
MIPKIIHYCWFGHNEKPKLAEKCIKSWKKYCPDYKIIEWNEDNFDIYCCPLYVRQAYEAKKWAFVTDYVRLKVVYDNGGVYFDTDVELRKPLDTIPECSAWFGFENERNVATGLGFGAEKNTHVLLEMMREYNDISFILNDGTFDKIPCPIRNTSVLLRHGLIQNNCMQTLDSNIIIFPTQYFCPIDYMSGKKHCTKETISIHWFSASWHTKEDDLYIKKTKRA